MGGIQIHIPCPRKDKHSAITVSPLPEIQYGYFLEATVSTTGWFMLYDVVLAKKPITQGFIYPTTQGI